MLSWLYSGDDDGGGDGDDGGHGGDDGDKDSINKDDGDSCSSQWCPCPG